MTTSERTTAIIMASRRLVVRAPPTLQVLVRSHDTSSCHSVILEANYKMTIALKRNLHEQTRSTPPTISLISQRFDVEWQINTGKQAFLLRVITLHIDSD